MTEKETFYYFAYGSNMLTRRLNERVPSALPIAVGYISGYRLTFDKVSKKDGSGKCDAEKTGRESDRVYGVIFKIEREYERKLDRFEGCGCGYEKEDVKVIVTRSIICEKINAPKAYIATLKQSEIKPYHWYKAFVIAGALEYELPTAYIEWLRTFESIEDPDDSQRAKNEAILFSNADSI